MIKIPKIWSGKGTWSCMNLYRSLRCDKILWNNFAFNQMWKSKVDPESTFFVFRFMWIYMETWDVTRYYRRMPEAGMILLLIETFKVQSWPGINFFVLCRLIWGYMELYGVIWSYMELYWSLRCDKILWNDFELRTNFGVQSWPWIDFFRLIWSYNFI